MRQCRHMCRCDTRKYTVAMVRIGSQWDLHVPLVLCRAFLGCGSLHICVRVSQTLVTNTVVLAQATSRGLALSL